MADNTIQENPSGNDPTDIDKLLGGIEEFEKCIEPALGVKSEDLEEKLASVRNQMDEAASTIQEYMLGDVHKTTDNLKDSYTESVKKLTRCTEQAEQSRKAFEEELTKLDQEYQKLNDSLEKRPETQHKDTTSFVGRIRAWWYLLVQDKIKRVKAKQELRKCRKCIIRYKDRLKKKEATATFTAAKQVRDYNLQETRNINTFLEQSEVYIKWGAVFVAVIYMSVYLSKLFVSHLKGSVCFWITAGCEVIVLIFAGLYFFRKRTPQKISMPFIVLLAVPIIHSVYLLSVAGDFLRTSGLASASNIDPSFFFFLFILLVIYSFRSRFLPKFDANIMIAGIRENRNIKKLIDNRFRLLLWRLWFSATLALVAVSTASTATTALSSTNEQRVEIGDKKYTLVMQLRDRLILVDPECGQSGTNGEEECKFFSVLSTNIPCLGPDGVCPADPGPKSVDRETFNDKVTVKELMVDKATVTGGLAVGSIRADSGQVDNLTVRLATGVEIVGDRNGRRYGVAAYEKLMACLDKTKTGVSDAFRVDFIFCKNSSDNPILSVITQNQNGASESRILKKGDNLNNILPQSEQSGEYHYIGTASDPGAWENNFRLGKERLEFVTEKVKPQRNTPVHKWPFGPLPLIELEQLLPKAKMDKLKKKINNKCPIENGEKSEMPEQIIQQFAQAVYCPVE